MFKVYAVYDSCAGIFGDPFICPSDAVAKRTFEYAISNADIPQYVRDDSVLYGLCTFDRQTGYFTCDVPPYVVSRGSTVVPDASRDTIIVKESDSIEK